MKLRYKIKPKMPPPEAGPSTKHRILKRFYYEYLRHPPCNWRDGPAVIIETSRFTRVTK